MKIDLFGLMRLNKYFDFRETIIQDGEELIIEIDEKWFKKEGIDKFKIKILENSQSNEKENKEEK